MQKRLSTILAVLVLLAMVVGACGAPVARLLLRPPPRLMPLLPLPRPRLLTPLPPLPRLPLLIPARPCSPCGPSPTRSTPWPLRSRAGTPTSMSSTQ